MLYCMQHISHIKSSSKLPYRVTLLVASALRLLNAELPPIEDLTIDLFDELTALALPSPVMQFWTSLDVSHLLRAPRRSTRCRPTLTFRSCHRDYKLEGRHYTDAEDALIMYLYPARS